MQADAGDDRLREVLDPENLLWRLVGSIFGPLYDGGRRRAQVAIQQSVADAQLAEYQDQVLQALLEVEGALAASGHLHRELQAQQAAAEATQRSVADLRESYGQGVADAIQVLQTARTAIRRRGQVLTLRQDRLLNHIDLALALGGPVLPPEENRQ
ncbi:MAG: TolC family protein [Planctomycetota bacterium]